MYKAPEVSGVLVSLIGVSNLEQVRYRFVKVGIRVIEIVADRMKGVIRDHRQQSKLLRIYSCMHNRRQRHNPQSGQYWEKLHIAYLGKRNFASAICQTARFARLRVAQKLR